MRKVSPRLVMVAGPNGSVKSTLIEALRASPVVDLPALYINADNLQRERNIQDPIEAQQLAKSLRTQAQPITTMFCTKSSCRTRASSPSFKPPKPRVITSPFISSQRLTPILMSSESLSVWRVAVTMCPQTVHANVTHLVWRVFSGISTRLTAAFWQEF